MKLIKTYESFNSSDIVKLCKKFGIKNYTINEDGSIDVDGDVDLSYRELTKLPLKFRNVSGGFYCYINQLTSLVGCPSSVGFHLNCSYNKLTSLVGCPSSVGGGFSCDSNKLTSLVGCPSSVGEGFYCQDNLLTSLEGGPKSIGREFICYNNKIVDLDDLENVKFVEIDLSNNPVYKVWKLFKERKHLEFFNDCDIIRDDSIVLDRLNFFLEEIGKPTVTEVEGYKII